MLFGKRKEGLRVSPFITIWGLTGLIFSGACLYLFFRLSSDLMKKSPFLFDQRIIDTVRLTASPAVDVFMQWITELGSTFMLGLLLLISMIWLYVKRKNVWSMLFFFMAVAGGGLLNLLLKSYFARERPGVHRIVEADGFSFPSGHSMGSMTFYGFLSYLALRSKRNPLSKMGLVILFGSLILLIGISRIYLGVHYPSDVLAGYTAGFVWLVLCISLLEIVYWFKENRSKSIKRRQGKTKVS
ncbi:phosphatase PAP2 family protein [Bacillus sp. FJAT-27251]|uniref:phosphatase PAP2 family protein n=1 Tax=Bacillus sp. FJAT-27251 TaxID=1684142 RepID=UPI0006A7BD17|nr:phosphatase PAP2 family protein [Bacillus sp. FJAT-27251]